MTINIDSNQSTDPPRLRVQSLGSGSSGNGFLVERGDTLLLVDCGIGIRTLAGALHDRQRSIDDVDAILLTHEHVDHVRTLPRVMRHRMPIVSTEGTFRCLAIRDSQWVGIDPDAPLTVADATIWALPVLHDAAQPCGYFIGFAEGNVTILTDLGSWHESLEAFVLGSDLVVLEANHDVGMLRRGPYPAHLKRRVASGRGHLSNDQCGAAISGLQRTSDWCPELWLAHLSATNNRPELAQETVDLLIDPGRDAVAATALPRTRPGPVWTAGTGTGRIPGPTRQTAVRPVSSEQLGFEF